MDEEDPSTFEAELAMLDEIEAEYLAGGGEGSEASGRPIIYGT